ncbi:MAG: asparagine synthase (glutamine-hydrolyzing) [Planctomycetota bacterium]|jgi:asparagine synthase (glutamine-hydrolysing)
MCGIAGAINYKRFDLGKITRVLFHRGPDEQNIYCYKDIALVHTRLSIQDIERGHQPMHYGPYSIVFNGEIYNHVELRSSLSDTFLTRSDTETLLHLYARYEEKCLDMLDGMFAFAVLDKRRNEIFLARDRAGEKPLYVYRDNDSLLFASELAAIKSAVPLQIDEENIYHYLRLCSFYKQSTPYRNVRELEAGSYARIDLNSLKVEPQKWWNIVEYYHKPMAISFTDALDQVEAFLRNGIKRRLESSDLEVGTFLSGGIDSSLSTAIAADYKEKMRTFTVSFEGGYDEAPLARLVAERYGTSHTEINISFDTLQDDLETIFLNYGEPFADSSAVPSYYVSKEAKRHLTVILNGDGGDELFAGYRRYVPFAKLDFFNLSPLLGLCARRLISLAPVPNEKQSRYNYLYRLVDLASKECERCYLSATTDIFEGFENSLTGTTDYLRGLKRDLDNISRSNLSGLQKLMAMDFDTLLAGNLLVKMDIATMAHALEGRSTFLTKELLEFAPRLPDKYKVKGSTTKYILRELARKYVPEELVSQPKRGFEVPLKKWIKHDLREIVFDHLDKDCYSHKFVKKAFLSNLLHEKIKISDEKRAKILWTLLSLEIWYRKNREQGLWI